MEGRDNRYLGPLRAQLEAEETGDDDLVPLRAQLEALNVSPGLLMAHVEVENADFPPGLWWPSLRVLSACCSRSRRRRNTVTSALGL